MKYEYSKQQNKENQPDIIIQIPDSVELEINTDSIELVINTEPVLIDSLADIYPLIIRPKYKVAYILPLYLNEIYQEEFKQKRISKVAQDYYMGAKMALEDSVPKLGLNLQVQVFDNYSGNDSSIQNILSVIDKDSYDLILGPFLGSHMADFVSYSLENKLPVISPISIKDEFLTNPYFISCRPTHKTHLEKSCQLIGHHFKNFNILVISKNSMEQNFIKECLLKYSDSAKFKSLNFIVVDQSNWGKAEYLRYLSKDSNLIYMPINDVVVINSVVTNLIGRVNFDNDDQKNKISLLAPYAWLNKSAVEISMLERLNAHFTSEPILDYRDSASIVFVRAYREKYKTEPTTYSWMGYQGVMLYAPLLLKNGKYIQRSLIENGTGCNDYSFIRRKADNGFEKSTIWLFRFKDQELVRVID